MSQNKGILRKMQVTLTEPVKYSLVLNNKEIPLTPYLGKTLTLRYTGSIYCIHCGRLTKKSFNQGYCYPCFMKLAQCDTCIIKPELCHYAAGSCREPQWGEQHCMQPHFVYLANSSTLKVGITRQGQIPTRWIDQGAVAALPILKVQSRYLSGLMEVAFKDHVADKTNWQQMLKSEAAAIDLVAERELLMPQVQDALRDVRYRFGDESVEFLPDAEVVNIRYPMLTYPSKVKSLSFDKEPVVEGVLEGIKGQYLLFDTGVINIRKFGGYEVEFSGST
ncbi:DUF2797 domain-containing protein [uncultured Thiothrix sp.]|uniref:DUF2797 domain-containing protein n=1 Tax=uncultured Thiothrix sp. TaxID=223185 RepID=UPI002632D89C|nr:DUF2797 domain-containing protein [uncultured Thiothrix sp.]